MSPLKPCARCGRQHRGICGIPPSTPSRHLSVGLSTNILGANILDLRVDPKSTRVQNSPDRKAGLKARIGQLNTVLDSIMAEIEIQDDPSLQQESRLLLQQIGALSAFLGGAP